MKLALLLILLISVEALPQQVPTNEKELKRQREHAQAVSMVEQTAAEAVLDERFLAEDPRLRYASRSSRAHWSKVSSDAKNIPASDWAARRETVQREKTLVGRFHKTGVGILAGTDTSNPYVMPGFGLHDELAMLVESGLTPMQALQAATLSPARFFNQTTLFGSVEKGKAADLLILNANPLEDIRNTTKISAVVVQGRFLDRQELDRILAEIEAAAQ